MTTPDPAAESAAPPSPPRRRRVLRTVEVARVAQVTPRVTRVTLTGDGLAGFASRAPAEHIKLFLPHPGEANTLQTVPGPDGAIFPPDQPRPVSRTYTPHQFRPDALELDVDIVRHGDGPGSTWAARAQPCQRVVIGGPGGGYHRPEGVTRLTILGDETSLPAISMVLRSLPESVAAEVFVEIHDRAEEQPLESAAQVSVSWLHQEARPDMVAGGLLEAALRDVALPDENGQVWIACEAQAMRRMRASLLHERGVNPAALYTRGYWLLGAANHPDHDYGEDVS